ncbi:MAG: ATP-dependent Clp protease ATP-binding subunit, partial [Rhodococcus sp.]|nr:ATP-dependent Clp protease ATP-binding subunit [Rhodococcus sp. (in: high G+C Gram-positive bacteria)]
MPAFFGSEGPGRIDISRLMSQSTRQLTRAAATFAAGRGDTELDVLHVLRVMTEHDSVQGLMQRAGAEPGSVADVVTQRLPHGITPVSGTAPSLSAALKAALLSAHQVAQALGSTYIDPEHLFIAFASDPDQLVGRLLAEQGITPQSMQRAIQGIDEDEET